MASFRDLTLPQGLPPRGARVLVALSGGADSVFLLRMLHETAQEARLTLAAAHFSHGLRPARAEEERAFCAEVCARLGVPLFCGSGDVRAWAAAHHRGIEESARRLRYDFLEETADRWGADFIATGHQQNDQLETILFHLIRGGGARGLSGIPARRGRYLRPLLGTPRQTIEQALAACGQPYLTDESNADVRFARNRLRHEVLPLLEEIHPGAGKSILSAAELLAQDDDCLESLAAGLAEQASASALAAAHSALSGRAVQQMWRAAGGGAELYRRQIEAVLALCAAELPSGTVDLPGGLTARRSYDRLSIGPASASSAALPELPLHMGEEAAFGEWRVLMRPAEPGEQGIDEGSIVPPVTVRSRREGDRLMLPGGSRSVKKWMIDRKIPREERASVPVVCDRAGVLAVGGTTARRPGQGGRMIAVICRRGNA